MENSILRTLKNFSLMERQIPICRILFMRVAFSSDGCNSDATLMQPYETVSLLSTVAKKESPPTGWAFLFDAVNCRSKVRCLKHL